MRAPTIIVVATLASLATSALAQETVPPAQGEPEAPVPADSEPEAPPPSDDEPAQPLPPPAPDTSSEPTQAESTAQPWASPAEPAPQQGAPLAAPELEIVLGAGMAAGILNLPKLGMAPTLWTRFIPPGWWPIEVSFDWWLDNEAALDFVEEDLLVHPLYGFAYPADGSRLVVRAYEIALAVCPYRLRLSAGDMRLCGGLRGGAMNVIGEGFAPDADRTRALLSAQLYARWLFRIVGPLRAGYSLGLAVPFLRPSFGYIDRFGSFEEKFQQSPIAGRLDLLIAAEL